MKTFDRTKKQLMECSWYKFKENEIIILDSNGIVDRFDYYEGWENEYDEYFDLYQIIKLSDYKENEKVNFSKWLYENDWENES